MSNPTCSNEACTRKTHEPHDICPACYLAEIENINETPDEDPREHIENNKEWMLEDVSEINAPDSVLNSFFTGRYAIFRNGEEVKLVPAENIDP